MSLQSYLQWISGSTATNWWCDSGTLAEIDLALQHGAVGITTNPPLSATAISLKPEEWQTQIRAILQSANDSSTKAEELVHLIVTEGARRLNSLFARTSGKLGYICAQVDPTKAGNREDMLAMGRRFSTWAPNISVKLPATSAGLEVLEELAAEGVAVTGTVSFTVAQMLAVAEAHERGARRALANGKKPAPCNAVLMIGRIDDYLTEVSADNQSKAVPADIQKAGLAIAKRAYAVFKERGYAAKILVAALRGTYHATELAGADIILSIHPKHQKPLIENNVPKEEKYAVPVEPQVLERLYSIKEFVRAYEPDGLSAEEFISFGVTQRTLSQFTETGWKRLENMC
jgi:transaldolase